MTVLERTPLCWCVCCRRRRHRRCWCYFYCDSCISIQEKIWKYKKDKHQLILYTYFRRKQMNISEIHFSYLNFCCIIYMVVDRSAVWRWMYLYAVNEKTKKKERNEDQNVVKGDVLSNFYSVERRFLWNIFTHTHIYLKTIHIVCCCC